MFDLVVNKPQLTVGSRRSQLVHHVAVQNNFVIFTGKHLQWSHFFGKVGLHCSCFPLNFVKGFRIDFNELLHDLTASRPRNFVP